MNNYFNNKRWYRPFLGPRIPTNSEIFGCTIATIRNFRCDFTALILHLQRQRRDLSVLRNYCLKGTIKAGIVVNIAEVSIQVFEKGNWPEVVANSVGRLSNTKSLRRQQCSACEARAHPHSARGHSAELPRAVQVRYTVLPFRATKGSCFRTVARRISVFLWYFQKYPIRIPL